MNAHDVAWLCIALSTGLGVGLQIVGWGLFYDFPQFRARRRRIKEWCGLALAIEGIFLMFGTIGAFYFLF